MDKNEKLIDFELIKEMLYGDVSYVKEFSEASVQSFTEFRDNFEKHLKNNDLDELRRTGHKIKPVAQMLHLDELLELYEKAKTALNQNKPDSEKEKLIEAMNSYCNRVLQEFENSH